MNAAGEAVAPPPVNANLIATAPAPFLSKTYDMVEDQATDAIVSWGPANNSFVVWNATEFARHLLPKYFKHNNFSSFVRQLNCYGFRKVDTDRWEFANEGFLRGQKHLLKTIARKKPSHTHTQAQQPQVQNSPAAACVEAGKFGVEEEIEMLKRDKNVLMQELVRLRQQQQSTDHNLQTLGQRLQGMEQRQQQMMTFLAKAMHSREFLAQLVQHNDSNRRVAAANKKRRLATQKNNLDGNSVSSSPDGQIIKYEPLINEAAKVLLRQIHKQDTSPSLESYGESENFFLESLMSLRALDSGSNSSQDSGVTRAEVPTRSGIPHLPTNSGFSAICSPPTLSEVQSPAGLADLNMLSGIPGAISPSQAGLNIPDFSHIPGMVPNSISPVDISKNCAVPEGDSTFVDPNLVPVSRKIEEFLTDSDVNLGEMMKENDPFWEQLFTCLPLGDAEEVDSSMLESTVAQLGKEKERHSAQNMESLTEQMGLLSQVAR